MTVTPVGYIALLRRNTLFRRLWYGQIVSQLGDWLDSIALYTLLLKVTGSGQAVGLLLVAQFLPSALVSPLAGVVVDRLPRKLIMVLSDLVRAVLVLGLLLVRGPEDIWLVYVITALKFGMTGFFEPARSAIIPRLAAREELVAANAISGVTWSAMLALGAAFGGIVVGTLGARPAFVLDSLTFLLSAVLIQSIPVVEPGANWRSTTTTAHKPRHLYRRAYAHIVAEFGEGLRYITRHYDIFFYTFSKGLWSLGGGVLLLLTLYGREIFPLGQDGAISIGLLYAARGVGTGLGPVIARRFGGESATFLQRAIGPAFFLSVLGYLWVSQTSFFLVMLLGVLLAHMGGSIQWVFSTALLQMRVPDNLLGRVFAVEFAALTLTTAISAYLTGVASDAGWSPRALTVILALVFIGPGVLLTLALWRKPAERSEKQIRS